MKKVKPLKKRTMTTDELQLRTLKVLKLVRKQLHRNAWQPGMCDAEFIERVITPLEIDIQQDRAVLKNKE